MAASLCLSALRPTLHQALCIRLSEEYEAARTAAEAEHAELVTFLRSANEALTDEARRRYQEAMAEAQAAHEAEVAEARAEHAADMERVRRYNAEIWPRVAVARTAQVRGALLCRRDV